MNNDVKKAANDDTKNPGKYVTEGWWNESRVRQGQYQGSMHASSIVA